VSGGQLGRIYPIEYLDLWDRKNGMQALMKYWNDPKTLAKIGERLGDVSPAAAAVEQQTTPAPLEINNLRDAAKYAHSG
jgi:hypothetical protein